MVERRESSWRLLTLRCRAGSSHAEPDREHHAAMNSNDINPDTRFATHMMPYAYDSVNMIVGAFETGQNPAVYLRNLRSYDGTAGLLTKAAASGNFASRPAVWTIARGKPALLNQ